MCYALSQSPLRGWKGRRTNLPQWLKWLPRLMRKLYCRGLVPILYSSFSFFWYSLYLAMTLSTFVDVDVGTKEYEIAIAEEAK